MIKGKRILAVVPARGGSKGIPLKNIQPLAGKPLLSYTAEVVRQIPMIDRSVASTDHQEIANVAAEAGLDVPFFRPPEISGDRIGDWDVLFHALQELETRDGVKYDIILMLQPTCPLRKPSHVMMTIEKLVAEGFDSVWTVSETDSKHHPLKQFNVIDGRLDFYDQKGKEIIARQQLSKVFHRDGAAYAITRECLLEQKTIYGKKAGAVIVNDTLVNIDTWDDFRLAEWRLAGSGHAAET